ncbi:sulfatase-like hydrolase/transferase [Saccharibacillus sp. CPCC 101409]|uniref:sulfatase family protein n=1 Tax=Saccharibacillus sp. CPCC 101409 TaxID=3058041 RepID=UPI0026714500|nr:sulfatase-like hydrolase/transferase [Saccharibacillus sp. CPCC 101409]MDO3411868.1 sulfatase-like hydrolase/transferase [Saccharibacillus sp. CPCC 101409]
MTDAREAKPDIIFLMTDQQRWDCIGRFNDRIHTPALDALAEEGITFGQAVCQAPMCVPSRTSMMFGYYPSQLGVLTNGSGLFDEEKLPGDPLPERLRGAGYQTAGFGKTHWNHAQGVEEPSSRGFEVRAIGLSRESGHYESGAFMMGDEAPDRLAAYQAETGHFGGGEENEHGYIGSTSRLPNHYHRDGWVAERALEFLDTGIDPDRPLFFYLSFLKPHAGFNVPEEFERLYRLEDIPDIEQPPWEEEADTHQSAADEVNASSREGYLHKRGIWEAMAPLERRRTTLRYWANCSWLDHYFGLALDKLRAQGRLEHALIVFVSDHGEMLSERRYRFTKYNLYDSSVRVPMILAGSAIPPERRGTLDDRPAELLDLLPTLTAAAGLPLDPRLPGLDLLSESRRPGAFCEFHGKGGDAPYSAPAYMWRTPEWKLILYMEGPSSGAGTRADQARGELYDLTADPHEWHNRYDEPELAGVRERLKTELLMYLASAWAKGPAFYDRRGTQPLE